MDQLCAASFLGTFDHKENVRMNDRIILFPANVINIIVVNNNRFVPRYIIYFIMTVQLRNRSRRSRRNKPIGMSKGIKTDQFITHYTKMGPAVGARGC